ncbi:hypothetical protein Bpfe_002965 [Biomphalaria pfeifferi]|uniref:Uncharacterized protein n=1 Tax=Biomphalaria pfeifferi TaxID=112525 RepID=A0AAD8FKN2_BIOPF|nr:hypothetical protein Bpfe_002965 [Biomphalaria pfeifferi]
MPSENEQQSEVSSENEQRSEVSSENEQRSEVSSENEQRSEVSNTKRRGTKPKMFYLQTLITSLKGTETLKGIPGISLFLRFNKHLRH